MAISNTRTIWQFYAGAAKTRRQALAHPVMAGNRFFATAKARRKKFYAWAQGGQIPRRRPLIQHIFYSCPVMAAKQFFLISTKLVD